MPSTANSANTTSADKVLLSYKAQVEGDCIPEETMEELITRIVAEVDSSARTFETENATQNRQVAYGTVAIGATEITFAWSTPFADVGYGVSFLPTGDPGAPIRAWIKSLSTTKCVFGVVGHTNATPFRFVATP